MRLLNLRRGSLGMRIEVTWNAAYDDLDAGFAALCRWSWGSDGQGGFS